MLSLAEELLLIALDDEKGTVPASAQAPLRYGLPAAGITELLLEGKLSLGEKQTVAVSEASPTGDEILDEMLSRIQESRKPRGLKDWVTDFGNGKVKNLQERLENRLVGRGLLRVEEGKFLRVFPWHHYPTVDGAPEAETREKLRAVLLGGESPDPSTAVLVSLLKACNLLNSLFAKEERKQADQRAKEIAKGNYAGEAVSKAVQEVSEAATAAMVAIMAATAASSSTSTS